MTKNDFINWLKGFTKGAHSFNISPKQWTELKEKLDTVEPVKPLTYQSTEGWVTTTTWQQ